MFQVVDPQPVVSWWSIGGQESGGREEKRMASVIKNHQYFTTHNTEEIAVETFNEWRGLRGMVAACSGNIKCDIKKKPWMIKIGNSDARTQLRSPLRPPLLVCGLLVCREKMCGRGACINSATRMMQRASGTGLSRLRIALCTGS